MKMLTNAPRNIGDTEVIEEENRFLIVNKTEKQGLRGAIMLEIRKPVQAYDLLNIVLRSFALGTYRKQEEIKRALNIRERTL